MDNEEKLFDMCKHLEQRLAAFTGSTEREFTVYDASGNDIKTPIIISQDADGDDIIEQLIYDGFLDKDGDYSTVYDGKDDEIEIEKSIVSPDDGDEVITCLTLKTFDELEDFDEFMANVLDIERTQYLSGGGWETRNYTIVTGTGGPHIEFTTDYHIHAYWGGNQHDYYVSDSDAQATMDRIEEYFNELYA